MAGTTQRQSYRESYIIGMIIIGAVAIRAALSFSSQPSLIPAIISLVMIALLYFSEPFLWPRLRWYRFIYFPLQTGLVILLSSLRPFQDFIGVLYIPLAVQVVRNLSRRAALVWVILYIILLTGTQIIGSGLLDGLAVSMLIIAVGTFLVSYDRLYAQAQADREESQALLVRLQDAHQKLQESAAQAEELAAARERNRLARELHDTVSQLIFSITLTARSAQLLLERDPARLPELLNRLQEMTGNALSQLRSLITQMRPPQKS